MQTKNPFNPTFGDVPNIFLDKQKLVDELITTIKESDFARSFFITGVRGSGKTSFLTKVSEQLQEDKKCYCVDLVNEDGILTTFARKLYYQNGSKLSSLFDSLNAISIGGFSLERSKELPNIEIMLEELMQAIQKKGKYVVVTIDEVTNSKAIQSFAKEFNALKRKKYPLYIIMTGLPDLVLDIQNDDKLTFLLRSEKIEMQPLSLQDIVFAYQHVFDDNFAVAHLMAQRTKGYSYAFQLQGYIYFKYLKHNQLQPSIASLNATFDQYQMMLFSNAYQKIFSGLSNTDRRYLITIAQHPTFSETVKAMQKSGSYVSQYRRRMIERHLITPVSHGEVAYTLPLFKEYIAATQNPDSEFYWYM